MKVQSSLLISYHQALLLKMSYSLLNSSADVPLVSRSDSPQNNLPSQYLSRFAASLPPFQGILSHDTSQSRLQIPLACPFLWVTCTPALHFLIIHARLPELPHMPSFKNCLGIHYLQVSNKQSISSHL